MLDSMTSSSAGGGMDASELPEESLELDSSEEALTD
jgi:hypothetical protein